MPGSSGSRLHRPNICAQDADQAVIDHIADSLSTHEMVILAREELRKIRHLPNEVPSVQRDYYLEVGCALASVHVGGDA